MRFLKGLFCAFGLISLASAKGLSWKLDQSCQTDGIGDMVSNAVGSAFSMASDEYDVLNKLLTNQDLGANQENIRNVVKWMFMKDGEEPNNARLNLLKTRLSILVKAKDRKDNEEPDGSTIVVYCGFDRFKPTLDGRWYDEDLDEVLEKDQAFETCKGNEPTVAYTWNSPNKDKPPQIQICPWFINWMKSVDTHSLKDAQPKALFWRAVSTSLSKMHTLLTPIDVDSLLDKVILHELTHTRVAGVAEDVDGPSFATVRYGWNRCRKLAQEGSDDPERESQVNADSIALCGSAIRFIKDGREVKENGDVV
ncbi:uncharacterized protein N7458_003830 [Penicillium daleae]|uniref:Lysine-specific metallo-endopeptidase domain-containing protein n=1 Tax=Penicillium daleae TaxID=63821 RepID=A0AAD6C951_9EURO|nr:uncharacterized protein N7458_003830 [Penicillium daleae]KAJ5455566.1 hypothetical protein N7458_003830 [Penicillium daleae]